MDTLLAATSVIAGVRAFDMLRSVGMNENG